MHSEICVTLARWVENSLAYSFKTASCNEATRRTFLERLNRIFFRRSVDCVTIYGVWITLGGVHFAYFSSIDMSSVEGVKQILLGHIIEVIDILYRSLLMVDALRRRK